MVCAIGIDLGGSSAKVALIARSGEVLDADSVDTTTATDAEMLLSSIAVVVDAMRARATKHTLSVIGVGCGVSGYLDPTGTRIVVNNTPALDGCAIVPWLQARFDLPIAVDNDACVAALAEARLGGLSDKKRILFVTVGSGIGVVLVADGTVVRVMHGVSGDASHLIVNHGSTERCPVGCRGCLETMASARGIAREGVRAAINGESDALARTLRESGMVTGISVSAAASAHDAAALRILRDAGHWLGVGLASWACIYAPEHILIGGAVATAGGAWLDTAVQTMRDVGMPLLVDRLGVTRATLGNQAGVVGAGLLALDRLA